MSIRNEPKLFQRWGYVAVPGCCGLQAIGDWKKVYIVVSENGELGTYKDQEQRERVKVFDIKNCQFYDAVKSLRRPCTIKIVTHGGNEEFVSADNLKDIDDLKCKMEQYNAKFMGCDRSKPEFDSKLEMKPVKTWNTEDCCAWLRAIGVPGLCKKFEEDSVTGQVLLSMDLTTFQQSFELEREFACNLYDEVREMQREGIFSKKKFVVRKKFRKFAGYREEGFDPSPVVETLCDPAQIKHKFLTTAERFFIKETTLNPKREEEETEGEKTGGTNEAGSEEISVESNDDDDDDPMLYQKVEQFPRQAKLRIKLVVTEAVVTGKNTKARKAASPLLTGMKPNMSKKFENFHTALIVGPWYLEWTDSELIVPKRMVSGRAVITADVETLYVKRTDLRHISDRIAEVVAKWNTKYKYRSEKGSSMASSSSGHTQQDLSGNCQDFVDEILNAIGVELSFEGALGDFVQKMRTYGKADLEFQPCQKFKDFFMQKKKGIFTAEELEGVLFTSHRQLDEFCLKVSKNCFEIAELFPSDWLLLKSFDRAFWMRYLQDQSDEKYMPLPPKKLDLSEFPTGCPFKDPRETTSFTT